MADVEASKETGRVDQSIVCEFHVRNGSRLAAETRRSADLDAASSSRAVHQRGDECACLPIVARATFSASAQVARRYGRSRLCKPATPLPHRRASSSGVGARVWRIGRRSGPILDGRGDGAARRRPPGANSARSRAGRLADAALPKVFSIRRDRAAVRQQRSKSPAGDHSRQRIVRTTRRPAKWALRASDAVGKCFTANIRQTRSTASGTQVYATVNCSDIFAARKVSDWRTAWRRRLSGRGSDIAGRGFAFWSSAGAPFDPSERCAAIWRTDAYA